VSSLMVDAALVGLIGLLPTQVTDEIAMRQLFLKYSRK
jgi:hypothetical protein